MEVEKIPAEEENNPEQINSDKVLEFQELSVEQGQDLKEKIKQHNGLVRVFIHLLRTPDNYEERVLDPFVRILNSENTPPVFLFEDIRDFEHMKRLLSEPSNVKIKNPVYLVKTLERVPYPVLVDRPLPPPQKNREISDEYLAYGSRSMAEFFVRMDILGVKKILIGGNNLVINGKETQECVANFISFSGILKNDPSPDMPKIDIKVSEITSPNNRSDLRGIRDDLI